MAERPPAEEEGTREAEVRATAGAEILLAEPPLKRMLEIIASGLHLKARLEDEAAPRTVAAFRRLLPLESRIIHVRWSGEAGWIPFGDLDLALGPENATSYPAPGELVLYPGGVSETEILLAYGSVSFASKAGPLAGNHFATIIEGEESLRELGRRMLWDGAQEIAFEEV